MDDFFDRYLHYTRDTEPCSMYHRWCAISAVSALLGRRAHFSFGHFTIYPNMYVMLIGEPGARKSTAIKIVKKLVETAGYTTFGPNRTSKEKFLAKLAEGMHDNSDGLIDNLLEQNLFGKLASGNDTVTECFVCNDEFNNFIGLNNVDFISLLGDFWDYEGVYKDELKNSDSNYISQPCINILGGNTHDNFNAAFPATVLGQGFFSRLLLVHGERLRAKITFPDPPDSLEKAALITNLEQLGKFSPGLMTLEPQAKKMLDTIYNNWKDLIDPRFASYSNRRFTHLLKIVLVYAATRFSSKVTAEDVLRANTVLSFTECYMSKAMGEIGKSRKSDILQKVMLIINSSEDVITFKDIWKHMTGDLDKMSDLSLIIQNLLAAGKIQQLPGGAGLLPVRQMLADDSSGLVDYSILSEEERNMKR